MKTVEEMKSEFNAKKTAFEIKAQVKAREFMNWASANKEVIIAVAPVAIAAVKGVNGMVRTIDRKVDLRKEQQLKDLYIYDRSMGKYLKLRRKLTSREQVEFDMRKRSGESAAQILASMRLLD